MTNWNRRQFIRSATVSGVACGGLRAFITLGPIVRATTSLRLGVVGRYGPSTSADGVTLGAEEGARSAQLFGKRVDSVRADVGETSVEDATRFLLRHGVNVLLSTLPAADDCVTVTDLARAAGVPVLNAAATDDALRGEECARHLFHVAASDAMYRSVLQSDQGSAPAHSSGTTRGTPLMWHTDLERFGAAQLNARFRTRFHRDMSSLAWAGWMAAKIGVEAFLRAGRNEAHELRTYLERDGAQFDGHKGVPLSFRAWDHQLRQPLYLPAPLDDRFGEPREVPGSSTGTVSTATERLDALGISATESSCHWKAL